MLSLGQGKTILKKSLKNYRFSAYCCFFPCVFWEFVVILNIGIPMLFAESQAISRQSLIQKMKNVKGYLLLFLFLAIIVPRCWALPDLNISGFDISFSTDYPKSGQEFTISATVHNIGPTGYSERVFAKNTEEAEPELRQVDLYNNQWLAQSFQYTEDVNLTGVSLYIRDSAEDDYDDSLTVTIETNLSTNVPSGLFGC